MGERRWLGGLVLLLTLIVVAGGLAEVILRAIDFSYYWSVAKRPDPHLGWAPPPGTVAWQRLEGKALVRINSVGLRDREHSLAKAPGTVRIAVLGDSFAEAVQLPIKQTFWHVLEQELSGCDALAGRPVEVINFGVSGYSTAQELLVLRHRVWKYQPDVVLLAFFQGNDLVENVRALDDDSLRPYFVFDKGRLVLDDAFLRSDDYRFRTSWYGRLGFWLLDHSRLLQAMDRSRDLIRVWLLVRNESRTHKDEPPEPGVDSHIFQPPQSAVWKKAWQVTDGLLRQMHREVADHGARFLVVTLSTGAQVHPDPAFRERFAKALGVEDLFYAERHLNALGKQEGFEVLNLAPTLQIYATDSRTWLHGFANSHPGVGHWNDAGHWLAGTIIAQDVCQGILSAAAPRARDGDPR